MYKKMIMKKAVFLFILISTNFIFSQNEFAFTLENENGELIDDNQTLEFNSVEYEDASFDFFIRNQTDEPINIRAEVTSFSGTNGDMMEFCFGECYFGVELNVDYPMGSFITINPGEVQNSIGDHFYNQDLGDGENPVTYSFRFFMVDNNGFEVISVPELITSYSVNYFYSSTLSNSDIDGLNFEVLYDSNVLNIISPVDCKLEINDILGRKITDLDLNSGVNLFENINFEDKVVIFRFKFSDGSISSKKFIF